VGITTSTILIVFRLAIICLGVNPGACSLAIRRASLLGNAEPFIDFMLERILETIKTKGDAQKKNVGVNVGVKLSARERDWVMKKLDNKVGVSTI
jgi:hypothetical protein